MFAIEQDAYDSLFRYLEEIKSNLSHNDDTEEITRDIENAIAEKFMSRKRSEKLAVTSDDVETVMAELGSPVNFKDDEDESDSVDEKDSQQAVFEQKRRLYRDPDDAVVAGVASGLANYFGIDPVIARLAFVVSVFFNGLGILAYIILWLVVPAAKTTTDKYAMRGERVTLKDISERVKKNIEHLDYEKTKGVWSGIRSFLDKSFQILGVVVRSLIVLVRYFVGMIMVVGGVAGIAMLVSAYGVILFSEKIFFPEEVQVALEILQGSMIGIVAMLSSFVMMVIPLIVIVISGSSLLAKRNLFTAQKAITLAAVWVVAVVVAGTTTTLQVEKVMQRFGPVEGQFHDSNFEVKWNNGTISGDDQHIRFYYDGDDSSMME